MTSLLLRLFVRNSENPKDPKVRSAVGRLAGVVGILCNLLLFGGKLAVGILSGSVSITADAMNNLTDATSSIVTLIGFKLAEKPADEDHPYGHARFEYLSGLVVAALIVVIGFELAKTSVEKIMNPGPVEFTLVTGAVLVGSILVKLWLSLFNGRLGKYIGSTTLAATAADSRNDVISTGVVLLSAIIGALTRWHVDGVMGLAVALFILYSGANLAKETISPLLGEAGDPELQEQISRLVLSAPGVLGYHDLMVHDYGPGQRFASIHVEMDWADDPMHCHEIIDNIERDCMAKLKVNLIVHYDPVVIGDPELDRLKALVTGILQDIDVRLSIHDFRMVRGGGHTNLIFDMTVPADLMGQKKVIKQQLDQALSGQPMRYYTVITYDSAVFNPGNDSRK